MKKNLSLFAILIAILISGCTSQKKLSYFNEVDKNAADSINNKRTFGHQAIISIGDRLAISVSAEDPQTVASFNLPFTSYVSPTSTQLYTSPSLQTYIVDIEGNILFPQIGKIQVDGMTRKELVDFITEKVENYVANPIVNVQFFNFKVSVLGEVAHPGNYTIINERTTILDALGMAGDMTPYGKRDNVLIYREHNGKIQFHRINLNNPDIFISPYYYVQQNDVIYVEPNMVRSISAQNIPLILSTVSTLATTVTLIYTISQSSKKSTNK